MTSEISEVWNVLASVNASKFDERMMLMLLALDDVFLLAETLPSSVVDNLIGSLLNTSAFPRLIPFLIKLSQREENALLFDRVMQQSDVENLYNMVTTFGDSASLDLLVNLTRVPSVAERHSKLLTPVLVDALVKTLCDVKRPLPSVAHLLCNLSQTRPTRALLGEADRLSRLLAFTTFRQDSVRQFGVVGTLRNICLDQELHSFILNNEELGHSLVVSLLEPLCASGTDQLDDEDTDLLPTELQYLAPPDDSSALPSPAVRLMLIEALHQLLSKRIGRTFLKNRGAYIVLRELHKTESEVRIKTAIENAVDILISEEPDPGDLKTLDIPPSHAKVFAEMDATS